MKLIYLPTDGERQEWSFRPNELLSFEAEALEDVGTWGTFEEFGRRFMSGNLKARRAMLWVLLRRDNPRLRFIDLVVRVDEVDVEFEADEILRLKEIVAAAEMSDEDRAEAMVLLGQGEAPADTSEFAPGKGEAGGDSSGSP